MAVTMATEKPVHKMARFDEAHEKEWIELPESSPLPRKESTNGGQIVTMTGTITRGYQTGQVVEVHMELTDDELRKLTDPREASDLNPDCVWGLHKGIHIFFFSLLCIPVALIASLCISFYFGTLTWYNFYLYFSEEKTLWHRVLICPILILTFPFTIGLSSFGIGLYACLIQISWFFRSWLKEIRDFEKGFYGWCCNKAHLPQCSPYEVVVLNHPDDDNSGEPTLV